MINIITGVVGIGPVDRPDAIKNLPTVEGGGLGALISLLTSVLIVGAGIYALFNFILAGYGFMSSSGDPQKVGQARDRITQTVIGLIVAAGAFVITAILSRLLFGSYTFLLSPVIPTV